MIDLNYENIIELDNLTWEDCSSLYNDGISVVLENGRITKLIKE